MLKRIHVDQHVIRRNKKNGTDDPPLSVKTYKDNIKCRKILIDGPSSVIYSPDKPLSCGARVWIETTACVIADCEEVE
jgi:hypothetical protein